MTATVLSSPACFALIWLSARRIPSCEGLCYSVRSRPMTCKSLSRSGVERDPRATTVSVSLERMLLRTEMSRKTTNPLNAGALRLRPNCSVDCVCRGCAWAISAAVAR
jgi:hypothetical protein